MILTLHLEMKKQLLITYHEHTPLFFEHVNSHYDTHNETLKMTQQKFWVLATQLWTLP